MIHNSELSCSSLPCNGGIFYLRGSDQRFNINSGTIANVRKVIGQGGIIYSDPYAFGSKLTFEQALDATFTDFYSKNNGSFIYLTDTKTPTFDIKFT